MLGQNTEKKPYSALRDRLYTDITSSWSNDLHHTVCVKFVCRNVFSMNRTQLPFTTVAVIGLGYIGLPTAATLATRGLNVVGVDVNEKIVTKISEGRAHFSEPDLDILMDAAVKSGKLRAVLEPEPADAFVIAVPTPFRDDKTADLRFVEQATRSVARVLKKGDLIILESTSPVGTTRKLCEWVAEERPDLQLPLDGKKGDINVAYCPERILPGRMVFELVQNDRIIGGMSKASCAHAVDFYKLFVRGTLLETSASTAEFVKLIENAYRDVNIAFANELSVLCNELKLNVWEAISLANRHPRVNILNPGPGVGGHCIAVDPWFLISPHRDATRLMAAARQVNDQKPDFVLKTVLNQMDRFKRPVVSCLGLAYKPDVDDLRESPALHIVQLLAARDAELIIVEPNIDTLPDTLSNNSNVTLAKFDEAVEKADIVVVLVGHSTFSTAPRDILLSKVVIDTVGLWQGMF